MSADHTLLDRTIIERYTDQPSVLPLEVRRFIEDSWGGGPVQLYACADLDDSMTLTEQWVALGPQHVGVAYRGNDSRGRSSEVD